jgi:glucokinase
MVGDGTRQRRMPTRYIEDPRVVLTLDAGGTNLVFGAVQGEREIVPPVTLSARASTLAEFLQLVITGFRRVHDQVLVRAGARGSTLVFAEPVAISFAFPGPADYEHGVIGDLVNLPVFRGGVPLGPMLEDEFSVPVFISNDGDLFALGEAIAGFLPYVNSLLDQAESPRRYRNLLGATFGTGFGAGIVRDGRLLEGDNSAAGEINRLRNRLVQAWTVEESVSVRGVRRVYCRETGTPESECPSPEEIDEIGLGRREGDRAAAQRAFEELAVVAGDALASAGSLVDGLVVIGGGLSLGHRLFLKRLVREMNAPYDTTAGGRVERVESRAYNLESPEDRAAFLRGDVREVAVPFSSRTVIYDAAKSIGVGVSRLGTARAVSVGAYTLALSRIDGA